MKNRTLNTKMNRTVYKGLSFLLYTNQRRDHYDVSDNKRIRTSKKREKNIQPDSLFNYRAKIMNASLRHCKVKPQGVCAKIILTLRVPVFFRKTLHRLKHSLPNAHS